MIPLGEGSQHPATTHYTPRDVLNERHHKALVEGSGIDPEVIAERGVRTVRKGRAGQGLPPAYSRRQKERGDGILFTIHRPNGQTATIFRPDEPDPEKPGHKYEQEVKRYGGSGNVLDVHPSLHHLIGDASVPVVHTEGGKKSDAMVSAARREGTDILPVAIPGVWNWMSDGEPIPDMFDIPVKGRKVYICFDSDMPRKPEVQLAAERLAEHLRRRGAEVEIVYLEDQPDRSKTGADDFLVAGGTLEELLGLARPYSPGDLQQEKLSRNEGLRRGLDYLRSRTEEMPAKTSRDCSKLAAWRACIAILEKRGEVVRDGIEAPIPSLRGAELGHMTQPTFSACMKDFEAEVGVRRIEPESYEEAYSFVFLIPRGVTLYNYETQRGESNTSYNVHPGYKALHPLQEVRWSTPGSRKQKRGVVSGTRKPRQGPSSGETEPKRRPGKKRDEVLRYVVANGGAATREELLERFGTQKTAWKDFKRNVLSELLGVRRQYKGAPLSVGPPVLELDDDGVRLVPAWEDAWEKHRILSGENEAARKQKRDNMYQRIAYRRRKEVPADPAPTEAEMAEGREDREKRRRIDRLVDEGMSRRFAVREVFDADPETGEMLDSQAKARAPEPPDDQERHPLDCECLGCSARAPRYARLAACAVRGEGAP
jgi:DNA-binding transcriptional LysR family regulator